jgi:uncharacterized membrane protein
MALEQRIKNGLEEARMVVLIVQVLLGFQFSVVMEDRFDQLSDVAQLVHLAGLGLLLAAFALGVAPATFHRIAEQGNDTARVLRYTSWMVTLALLPFSAALGAGVFVVVDVDGGRVEAMVLSIAAVVAALTFWMAWPLLHRRGGASVERDRARETDVETKITHTLTEARMVLPGAQALLGFQFIAFFVAGFEELTPTARLIHLGALMLVSLATIMLIAPAAFDRLAERGRATRRFYRYASRMVQASLVPLALGMSGDFYVVVSKVTESSRDGELAAAAFLIGAFALWFCVPWIAGPSSKT